MLSFLLCFLLGFGGAHEFHVSVADMKLNKENKTLETSVSIFIDDLELALSEQRVENLRIGTDRESKEADALIEAYLKEHFQLSQKGELLPMKFYGKEMTDDLSAVWCYIEFSKFNHKKSFQLKNTILVDVFKDQQNMVNYTITQSLVRNFTFGLLHRELEIKP